MESLRFCKMNVHVFKCKLMVYKANCDRDIFVLADKPIYILDEQFSTTKKTLTKFPINITVGLYKDRIHFVKVIRLYTDCWGVQFVLVTFWEIQFILCKIFCINYPGFLENKTPALLTEYYIYIPLSCILVPFKFKIISYSGYKDRLKKLH